MPAEDFVGGFLFASYDGNASVKGTEYYGNTGRHIKLLFCRA